MVDMFAVSGCLLEEKYVAKLMLRRMGEVRKYDVLCRMKVSSRWCW